MSARMSASCQVVPGGLKGQGDTAAQSVRHEAQRTARPMQQYAAGTQQESSRERGQEEGGLALEERLSRSQCAGGVNATYCHPLPLITAHSLKLYNLKFKESLWNRFLWFCADCR